MPYGKRKFKFRRRIRRSRMVRRKAGFIRKIAKRSIYSLAETKQYVTIEFASNLSFFGTGSYRTEVFPLNGAAINAGGSAVQTGPAQGTALGDRIGNAIWSKGATFSFIMSPQPALPRTILPVRMTILYFNKGYASSNNVPGNPEILNTINQLTSFNRIDVKECTVLKDKRMLFFNSSTNPSNGVNLNVYYKRLWVPFKYKKHFKYQSSGDFAPNNATYLLCFTYPYDAVIDANVINIRGVQSLFFKDV